MSKENSLVYISVEQLLHHPENPRKNLGDLTELTESIRTNGVLQNLTVVTAEDSGHYYVVIGNRRMEAAKAAGLTELPCTIAEMTRQEQVRTMFVENVQRADLTPYEQAECLQMMIDLGESPQSVATQTGLSETTVSRRLRLLKLDKKKFDQAEERGGTSLEQYIKIAEVERAADRKELLDAIGTDNFNRKYQYVIRDQNEKKNKPKIIKEVSAFAKPLPKGHDNWSSGYVREKDCAISNWKPGDMIIEKPKKNAEYFYYLSDYNRAYIMRKVEAPQQQKKTVSEKEKTARKRRKHLAQVTEEMYQLRRNFLKNLSVGAKNRDILFEWALTTIVGSSVEKVYRHGRFEKGLLQETIGQDPKRIWDIQSDLLRAFYENSPGSAATLIIYGNTGDCKENGYYYCNYGEGMPYHQKNRDLDLVYEYLCRLGYCMSDEEKQLQDGTHLLFAKE